jgi:hypothetical protein
MSTFILLLLSFLVAKGTLLAVVLGTTFLPSLSIPFISTAVWPFGYDSSSTLFLPDDATKLGRITAALLRWDSVYFVSLADREEYVWEQEWAFGPGWPMLIRYAAPCIQSYVHMLIDSAATTSSARSGTTTSPRSHRGHPLEFTTLTCSDTIVLTHQTVLPQSVSR